MNLNERREDQLREAKTAIYRDLILDVAEEVFARSGFNGARVKEIAAAARISLSTLYSFFADKASVYQGVHERRLGALMKRLAVVSTEIGVVEQMLRGIGVYVQFHMQHPVYLRMHLREGIAWSGADGLRSRVQIDVWSRGLRRMARTFGAGVEAGVFEVDDPLLAARTVNAMHQVALSHWVEGGMAMPPDVLIRQVHRQFLRTFCPPARVVELLREHT